MIPALDPSTGRLPFVAEDKPYQATLDELEITFCEGRLASARRRRIWDAFLLWHSLAQHTFPGARYWISGSFLTERDLPSDLDVILVLDPKHQAAMAPFPIKAARVLLSHLNVSASQPKGTVDKLQPMGGLVDGFWCYSWVATHVEFWQSSWSTVYDKATRRPTGQRMGFLEVTP